MFDLATFKQAVAQRNRDWATTHKILYRLCSEMPQHSDLGETRAKLLIIGRSFATGIERAIHSKGGQGSAIEQLADYVCRNAGQIDKQFARLRGLDGSCPEHLREAVDVHGKLMEVLKKGKRGKKGICRPNRSPRSFVSKYLHFHFPFVPIYDNYSRRGLNREVHWTEEVNALFLAPVSADNEYCCFSKRFWILHQEAQRMIGSVTVKELDDYLCYLGGLE